MIQAKYYIKYTGIPTFALKIKQMSYYMYFILAQVGQSIHQLAWKDNLDNLRYLENLEVEKKKVLLSGIVESVGVIFVGEKRYSIDTLVQAFEYFVL